MDNFYQLAMYSIEFTGTLVSIDKIDETSLISGRMPKNDYEIVTDKKIVDNMLSDRFSTFSNMGVKSEAELLGKKLTIDGMGDFEIVGFTNNNSASIYANKSMFINILSNMSKSQSGIGLYINSNTETTDNVKDYNLCLDDIKLTKGKLPKNDYEVIVNENNKSTMKLNKQINVKINGKKLKVVGYYSSKTDKQEYLVNNNTVKYDVITKNNGFMIYPKDKQSVMDKFQNEYKLNIINRYEQDKQEYLKSKKSEIRGNLIFAGVILAISLIEIYLMIRSSFLSRIKEVGVLRAIGVKKQDIYRMFVGEIISITTVANMPGLILMAYILSQVSKIPYMDKMFIINFTTVGISILIIYLFNILVGLAPLFKVLRKTPAKILARHDVE